MSRADRKRPPGASRRLGAALAAALFLVAGCASVVRIAYNNGDYAVRMLADDYFALNGGQVDAFNTRLARFHEWHRLEEIGRAHV